MDKSKRSFPSTRCTIVIRLRLVRHPRPLALAACTRLFSPSRYQVVIWLSNQLTNPSQAALTVCAVLYGFEPQVRCPITPPLEKCLSTISLRLLKQLLKDQPHLVSASRLQVTSRQSGKLLLDFERRSQPQVPFPFNCLCSRDSCRRASSTASPISFIR